MELAKVIGHVVATIKLQNLSNGKLLFVQTVDEHGNTCGLPHVALDTVGAGEGEYVLLVRGSSARVSLDNTSTVDLTVVGIVDNVYSQGKLVYSKHDEK